MTLVRIVKPWQKPDLLRQTPGGSGVWDNVHFTLDAVARCDWLVVLNHVPSEITVEVPPENVLCFVQEPPLSVFRWMLKGFPYYGRIYTQDRRIDAANIHHSHGSLPWHLERSYDELKAMVAPKKTRDLSWITSSLAFHDGHRHRLAFLKQLRASGVPFDLFGRGFQPLADKWDGIAPYRYTIAVENHSCPDYWTEKIADCFLAWSMPIYFGATNLSEYFPEDSYVWIDINDPNAPKRVAKIVRSDLAERNRDAIAEARRRVLDEHNLFPRIAQMVRQSKGSANPKRLTLPHVPDLTAYYTDNGPIARAWNGIRRRLVFQK
ncbi:MAG: glycosyltransferase family 10 [Nibricoccus sp.]